MLKKWNLFLTTIPYIIVVVLIRALISDVFGFEGWVTFRDVALILTGGIFLTGFMLSGTMADYKESEKIPSEIASYFETAEDTINHISSIAKSPIDRTPYLKQLASTVDILIDWLYKRKSQEDYYESLHQFAVKMADLEKEGANGSAVGKLFGDIHNIRKITTRVAVISRTDFLATGYALLEVLIFSIHVVLMIANYQSSIAEKVLTPVISMIYIYMYRLIRDVDDPFEYEDGKEPGVTEIPLFPITEYRERLQSRIEAAEGSSKS
ncbi:MAG: hypothetical protein KDK54_16150 [Leptospiraceae bacterium]|nr:hypothetical protein [Leptospiraceae bacterium]